MHICSYNYVLGDGFYVRLHYNRWRSGRACDGVFLQKTKKKFLIIDKEAEIGDVWRKRYDSLTLFTPRMYSSLPGLPMEGEPMGYPTKDEIADYLARYAKTFSLRSSYKQKLLSFLKPVKALKCTRAWGSFMQKIL